MGAASAVITMNWTMVRMRKTTSPTTRLPPTTKLPKVRMMCPASPSSRIRRVVAIEIPSRSSVVGQTIATCLPLIATTLVAAGGLAGLALRSMPAALAPRSERLSAMIWADRRIAARLSPTLDSLASELEAELGKTAGPGRGTPKQGGAAPSAGPRHGPTQTPATRPAPAANQAPPWKRSA